jgi:RHS repeat-associated protein
VRSDHIGRPVFATNAAGTKVWTASYLPFGGVRTTTGTPPTARFPGQWFQSESGLHQNWMRDYDPTTGRYLQADPLGLVDGASVYGYANQSPMMYVDPNGENPVLAAIAISVALNVAVGYLSDYWLGDGCYTWYELGRDAAIGAAFGPLGLYGNAGRLGVGVGSLSDDAARGITSAMHGHHPIAKFLGGNSSQVLTRLPQVLHTGTGGFHSQLNAALRAAFGRSGGGASGSATEWAKFFSANPGSQRQAMDILLDVSRNFDFVNGTSVTSDVWTNVINGAFTVYP